MKTSKADSPGEERARAKETGEATAPIQVEATREGPVLHRLSVTVSADRVRTAMDRAYRELAREARVRGFRPGKAPRSVLEKLYGASVREEIEHLLVAETLSDALELAELEPVVQPDVESEPPPDRGPFQYRARVETKPEIELPELEGLSAERPSGGVEESAVESHLEELRQRSAPMIEEPEQTPAALGHHVDIDFVGRVDGKPFEGGSGQGVTVELGAGRMVPGFEEQLVGACASEDRQVNVTFPDDYGAEALRGKHAEFSVHVAAVKRREVPELDDEFAKDLGLDSLEVLRERVHADLLAAHERRVREALDRSVMDSLIACCEFDVPVGLVERQLRSQMSSMKRRYEQQVPREILENQLARMQEEGRPGAERRVREMLLLEAVAKAQDIQVDDADVDQRLDEIAAEQNIEPAQLREMAREQGWRAAIESELVERRALDFLVSGATVAEATEE